MKVAGSISSHVGSNSLAEPWRSWAPRTWEVPLYEFDVNSVVSNLPLLRSHDVPCLYRRVVTPQYSYTMESSSPHRWELESVFLALSQVVEHTNYDNYSLQVIWTIKTWGASWGQMNILPEFEKGTQSRHYLIALILDWLAHSFETLWHCSCIWSGSK